MKNHFSSSRFVQVFLVLAILSFVSCESRSSKEIKKLQAEKDSLSMVIADKDSAANAMTQYLETIASSIDSIKTAETILTLTVDQDGKPLKKDIIRENLRVLEEIIQRQRNRIEQLEGLLLSKNDSTSSYRTLITNLYEQIDIKDAKIKEMQDELKKKEQAIASLNKQVISIQNDLATAEEKNREQNEMIELQSTILSTQDKIVNTGYFIAGKRKELQDKGILSKSLIPAIVSDHLTPDLFNAVDMREFKEITLNSKKIKILSSMPEDSYSLHKSGNNTILRIEDPGRFWNITPYLVIQLF